MADVTGITNGFAAAGGEILKEGDAPVTERGICWSADHFPTTLDGKAEAGEGTGSFRRSARWKYLRL